MAFVGAEGSDENSGSHVLARGEPGASPAPAGSPAPGVGPAAGSPWRSGLARVLTPPVGDPVHAIYGTVITAGLLSSEDPAVATTADIALSVLVTVVVFWLSHGYAEIVGRSDVADSRNRLVRDEARQSLAEHWPMVQAAVLPLVALFAARLVGASVDDSLEAALWTSTVLLALWGYVAGRARRLPWPRLVGFAATSFLLGVLLVGLETSIH